MKTMKSQGLSNFGYNIVGALVPIATSLVTVPLYLTLIGPARYGVVSITWILLGYFGFLDFGLSRASANALGKLGHASPEERGSVLMTALYLNLLLGVLGSAVLFVSGKLLLQHVIVPSGDLQQEIMDTFPWIVPMLPLGMIMGVATGAIESRERFLLSNVLQSSGTVLGQVMPLLFASLFGATLATIIPALMLVRLIVVVGAFVVVLWIERPVRLLQFDLVWARKLFGYGAWVSVSSLLSPILDTFDQILIGHMLGATSIAHYSVPMNLSLRSQLIAGALGRTLFPRVSRVEAVEGRRIIAQATTTLLYVFGAVCGPVIVVVGPFFDLWVGREFSGYATPVAQILMIGAWTNGIALMPYSQLQAQGRPDLTAKVHALEVVPFVAGLWALITLAGLPGAALAWTLRVTVDCIALLWLARCLRGALLRSLPAMGLMALSFAIAVGSTLDLLRATAVAVVLGIAFLGTGMITLPLMRETVFAIVRNAAPKMWRRWD